PLLTLAIDGDPLRVRLASVLVGGVRIGAGNYDQAQFAAADHQISKGIGVMHPGTAMMVRNLGRVVSDASTGTEAARVTVSALRIIQPELQIVLAGIVLHQGELPPAHRFIAPGRSGGRPSRRGVSRQGPP